MKQHKIFLCGTLLSAALSLCSLRAAAIERESAFDPFQTCSLRVTLALAESNDVVVTGAEVSLYRVADINMIGDEITYTYCKDFADCQIPLTELENADLALKLYDYTSARHLHGISLRTDKSGQVLFRNLKAGVYLGAETESGDEESLFTPFVVCLPSAYNAQWSYDIDASPKVDVLRLTDISVSKIWNDDGSQRPENVEIQLTKNNSIVDTVELSDANEWNYIWKNMPYEEGWNVKEINVPQGYAVTYQQKGMSFTVCNTAKLVQTGQRNLPIPLLSGSGLLLIMIGILLRCSGKKGAHET